MTRAKKKTKSRKKKQPTNWVQICAIIFLIFILGAIIYSYFYSQIILETIFAIFNPRTYMGNQA